MRARTHKPLSAVLFSLGLASLSAAAQSKPGSAQPEEREVILPGAPEDPPAVVYAAANLPLVLVFDAPLRTESAAVVPGAEVRPHPFLAHALVVTPSNALADQSSAPLSVALANGGVALKLAFTPERTDRLVRVVRRAPVARSDSAREEIQKAWRLGLEAAFAQTHAQRSVDRPSRFHVVEGLSYLLVHHLNPKCFPRSARLLGGPEPIDALLVEPIRPCDVEGRCDALVVMHAVPAGRYTLDVLAQDGAQCRHLTDVTFESEAP